MKPINAIKNQWKRFKKIDRSVKLFISITILFGVYFAGRSLFANFYILSRGFDKDFLGLANSMGSAATLVLSLPMGVLTDRVGRKQAMLLGIVIMVVSYAAVILASSGIVILMAIFVAGIGETLFFISQTPLLVRLTTRQNRNFVFSLNFGLSTLSGVFGSYLSGQMPAWLQSLFGIQPETIASYQGILFFSLGFAVLMILPLMFIDSNARAEAETPRPADQPSGMRLQIKSALQNMLQNDMARKLFFVNLLTGLGAALMVPYFNLFFKEVFSVSEQTLGTLFSLAALLTGFSTLFSPWLTRKLGTRVRAIVAVQGTSLLFLAMVGFSPWLGLAVIGFLGRGALMNMANPLISSFSMEQVEDHEQGTLSSVLTLSWQIGWAIMPLVSGIIQARYGFTPIFIITGLLYAVGISLTWVFFHDKEVPLPRQAVLQVP